jgi:colanic acid/amylovoran biosynthesis glycosyltransferase
VSQNGFSTQSNRLYRINVPERRVAIFRKRLLSYSETFIADQGQLLPTYEPLYCGYDVDASGQQMIANARRILLSEYSRAPSLSKLRLRHGLGGGRRWLAAIAELNPALMHAHFFNDGSDAIRLVEKLQLPLITTVHGHDITKHDNAGAQLRLRRKFFSRVDRVIAVSNYMAEQALERGCPEHKLRQHYIGIDLEKFTRPKAETEQPSILFVGRLVEKKGCTYLLQAIESLQARFPDLTLTLVGDGDLRQSLEREVEQRGINAEFTGSETAAQIRERLARCWVFAAPSITAVSGDTEGLGMVFLEAQALNTPVVSFRSGGVVEAVADGVSGLLCEEKDVPALAANMAELLENSNLRHNMGAEGRKRIETEFDVRRQCAKLEQIYDELI